MMLVYLAQYYDVGGERGLVAEPFLAAYVIALPPGGTTHP